MSPQPSGIPSGAVPNGAAVEPIRRVGVVGAGLMGSGIAEVCARAGLDVRVAETCPEAVEAGRDRITQSLARAVRSGRLAPADSGTTLRRIGFTTDLADLADRDIVIEAVAEDERVKTGIFAMLDKVVTRPDAILASNTSSIPIMKLGTATGRAQQVIGVHFFNPVPVLDLVELVPSLLTSDQTRDRAGEFVSRALSKQVIQAQDRAGFVVNSLLVPYLLSAIRMLESGLASADDIDNGMVLGCAHPMGPLRLADLIGLDTLKAIADSLYAEYKEPLHAAPPLLLRMVDAGLLGRKTGQGFHDYSDGKKAR
jgi:3-hydroxybutyryl-CoA dehydrogenase